MYYASGKENGEDAKQERYIFYRKILVISNSSSAAGIHSVPNDRAVFDFTGKSRARERPSSRAAVKKLIFDRSERKYG